MPSLQQQLRARARGTLVIASGDHSDVRALLSAAADRIDALEAALREIGDCVGTLSPHAIGIQVRKAIRGDLS